EGMTTSSGYARTIRRWQRGQNAGDAPVIFDIAADHMGVFTEVDRTGAAPRVWLVDKIDFFHMNLWLGDASGAHVKLDVPSDGWPEAHADWLAIKLRSPWTVGGRTYASDSVLGISLSAFLAGDRNFSVVFEPGPRRALQGFFWAAGRLVLP